MDTETILQAIREHATTEVMEFDELIPASGSLLKKLSQQRSDYKYCDVTLTVNKTLINVHQCVMAAASSYFDQMFINLKENLDSDNNNKTSKNNNGPTNDLEISARNPDAFMMMIDYVYSGQIKITSENIADIIDLATQFSISKLQDLCSRYLKQNINDKTCFYIHHLAKQHNLSSLLNMIDSYVFVNINRLVQSGLYLDITLPMLEIYLGRSVPLTEIQRLDAIFQWIEHKFNVRKDCLPILLKLIHWSAVDDDVINKLLLQKEYLMNNEWMCFHLLQSLNNSDKLFLSLKEKFSQLRDVFLKINDTVPKVVSTSNDATRPDHADENNFDDASDDNDSDGVPVVNAADVEKSSSAVRRESARIALRVNSDIQCINQKSKSLKRKNVIASSSDEDEGNNDLSRRIKKSKFVKNKENTLQLSKKTRSKYQKRKKITCTECPFIAYKPEKMNRHISVAHKDSKKTYTCDLCQFKCKWNRQFYNHLRSRHFKGPPYHCDKCGYKSGSIQSLLLHRIDHLDKRPHVCDLCGASFKVKSVLDAHAKTHSGERAYKCTECSKCFSTKGTLTQHMSSHNSHRPFLCDLCGFSTKYQSHLKAHSRLHTGEVFYCQYEGCTYKTPKRSQLACHQRTHLNLRNHTCDVCGRSFLERSHLVRHKRLHSSERPFACEKCGYSSTRRDKLKEHQKKYHDENVDGDEGALQNKRAYRPRKSKVSSGGPDVNFNVNNKKVVGARKKGTKKFIDVGNDLVVESLTPSNNNNLLTNEPHVSNIHTSSAPPPNNNSLLPSNTIPTSISSLPHVNDATMVVDVSNTNKYFNNADVNVHARINDDNVNASIHMNSGIINVSSYTSNTPQQTLLTSINPLITITSTTATANNNDNANINISNSNSINQPYAKPIQIDTNIDNTIVHNLFKNNANNYPVVGGNTRLPSYEHTHHFHSFSSSHYSSSSGVSNDPTGSSGISDMAPSTNLMISPSTNNFSSPGNNSQNLDLSPSTLANVCTNISPGQSTTSGLSNLKGLSPNKSINSGKSFTDSCVVMGDDDDDDDDDTEADVTVLYLSDGDDDKVALLKIKNPRPGAAEKSSSSAFQSKLEQLKAKKLVKERLQNYLKTKTDLSSVSSVSANLINKSNNVTQKREKKVFTVTKKIFASCIPPRTFSTSHVVPANRSNFPLNVGANNPVRNDSSNAAVNFVSTNVNVHSQFNDGSVNSSSSDIMNSFAGQSNASEEFVSIVKYREN
ncbi:hypothetical protein HELRODRAFT_191577 [Helobdella robusta]|uniref:BTB domain-containing protein n=1 Tax=Helobdella robusta TaxID=6412 RepID=T1FT35_HELRO|nr:hypothetical protein HELRODRAFT_191577 [Helobdella robusta]ESO05061.1 hypothetical protein HELRODRAFT_191577 [Helobdella robusta]